MCLGLSGNGNKRYWRLFKFLQQRNGNSEGSSISLLCYFSMPESVCKGFWVSLVSPLYESIAICLSRIKT
jgi:hypothetical protein